MTSPKSDNNILHKVSLDIAEGYETVSYLRRKRKYTLPPFRMMGRGGKNKGGTSMNLVQELTKLSKPAAWMFSEMEANMDFRLNTAILKASHYSETDRRKLISGYKELNKNDLVKRIKREHYLINPRLIIPGDNFESVLEQYEKL